MNDEEKKIIIDEDWKSTVEKEREQMKDSQGSPTDASPQGQPQMPEASFPFLVSTISAQVLSSLGQFPDPMLGKPVIRLDYAKLNIDTLEVLQEKTKGNLTDEESEMLEQTLHELRMLFLAIETEIAKLSPEDLKRMSEEFQQPLGGGPAAPGKIDLET